MNAIRRPTCRIAASVSFALLASFALPAFAQFPQQNLTIAFDVSIPAAPLSDWLTIGIALLLAATALVAMRRQRARGARFFGALLALAAAATIFSVTGHRLTGDANAGPGPAINLVTSPASLNLNPFIPIAPTTVSVNNMTGKFAKITAITLDNPQTGFYTIVSPTTCAVGLTLGPGSFCVITLSTGSG